STLKGAGIVSIFLALSFWYLIYKTKVHNNKSILVISITLFTVCILSSIVEYEDIPYRNFYPYSFCESGIEISKYSKDNEVIFLKDSSLKEHHFPINPIMVTCAKRNIAIYKNKIEARKLLKENNTNSGIIFTITYYGREGGNITKIETIKSNK
ncbi:MAG: hypothetical protein WCO09_04995, partial [bacterium]